MSASTQPVVVIAGRPNVGKSTLFNRSIRRREAVVDAAPGITRDRHFAKTDWNGTEFTLVDTGGYLPPGDESELSKDVSEQTLIAANEADLVLFVMDARTGISDVDQELASILQRGKAPVIPVCNKIDDTSQIALAWEINAMGLGDPVPTSALTGFQFAEMLDILVENLEGIKGSVPSRDSEELSIAIIGAPNSGKSSLVNLLSGENRMVVSDIPGTTRDAVDTIIKYHGRAVRLVDTAGLRRKKFGISGIEFYTALRTYKALDRCDIAVLMIDGVLGLTNGDLKLMNETEKRGVGIIIAVNKWDAVEKDPKTADNWLVEWERRAPRQQWIPIYFISALTGQRAIKLVERAFEVKEQRDRRISTSLLNEKISEKLIRRPPPAIKGKAVRIKYGSQVRTSPPHFVFFASHAKLITDGYAKFTEGLVRSEFTFRGVPIKISFRDKR